MKNITNNLQLCNHSTDGHNCNVNLCHSLWRQNSVTEIKISSKVLDVTPLKFFVCITSFTVSHHSMILIKNISATELHCDENWCFIWFIVMQLWTLMKQRRKFLLRSQNQMLFWWVINIGNRTDSSPIQPVIIRVIDKIGRPWSTSPICQLWVWVQN